MKIVYNDAGVSAILATLHQLVVAHFKTVDSPLELALSMSCGQDESICFDIYLWSTDDRRSVGLVLDNKSLYERLVYLRKSRYTPQQGHQQERQNVAYDPEDPDALAQRLFEEIKNHLS